VRRFSTLKYLDGQKVAPLIEFGLPTHLSTPDLPPIKGYLSDTPDTQRLVEEFLQKFFALYDAQSRDKLLDIYSDSALFSMSTSTASAVKDKQHFVLTAYKQKSRNLVIVKDLDRRVSMLHSGRVAIVHCLNSLPQTRHSYDNMRIDAYVLPNIGSTPVLCINLQGDFYEVSAKENRSYDRTLLLAPCPPNSPAAVQGRPVIIMNDQLHVRHYAPLPPIAATTTTTTTTTTTSTTATILPAPSPQLQLIEKLSFITRLKPDYARQCLEQNLWSYDKALEAFMSLKQRNQIGPGMLM